MCLSLFCDRLKQLTTTVNLKWVSFQDPGIMDLKCLPNIFDIVVHCLEVNFMVDS